MRNTTKAPWTDEQVRNLLARQEAPLHEYTCLFHGSAPLRPTNDGWVCPNPVCEYTQDWAFYDDVNRPHWWR